MMQKQKKCGARVLIVALLAAIGCTLLPTTALAADSGNVTQLTAASYYEKTLGSGTYQVTQPKTTFDRGLHIEPGANVTLIIPSGYTVEAIGGFGYKVLHMKGLATAGVTIPASSTLTLRGGGTLNAKGGDGFAGQDGVGGVFGIVGYGWLLGENKALIGYGSGGSGGQGGGSPGAGIGGDGVDGGMGGHGSGGDSGTFSPTLVWPGTQGGNGFTGNVGAGMGTLYVLDTVQVTAQAGVVAAKGGVSPPLENSDYPGGAPAMVCKLYRNSTEMYLMGGHGGPGGGGGISGASANIGGSGSGGGGGGSGNRGGAYLGPTSECRTFVPMQLGGTGGAIGGAGGIGAYPVVSSTETPAVGAGRGQGGTGGQVYVASGARVGPVGGGSAAAGDGAGATVLPLCAVTVNVRQDGVSNAWTDSRSVALQNDSAHIKLYPDAGGSYSYYVPIDGQTYRVYLDGEDTGKTVKGEGTATSTSVDYYMATVTVNVNDSPAANKNVTLIQNGLSRYSLTYDASGQCYQTRLIGDGSTYQIYLDGADSGSTLSATLEGKSAVLDYYSLDLAVTLDNAAWTGRRVTLSQDGEFRYAATESGGKYSVVVPRKPGDDADNTYDISVDDRATGLTATASADGRTVTVPFQNAKVTLKLDTGMWTGQNVVLSSGSVMLPATEKPGAYNIPLLPTDNTVYTVMVNGEQTAGVIQMSDDTKRTATLTYFTASVKLTRDGSVWSNGPACLLKQEGVTKYRLPYDSGSSSYKLAGVAAGTYEVSVLGSDSAEETEIQISNNAMQSIPYFTVTYNRNITDGGDWATQTVRSGATPSKPSDPYQSGYTFLSWQTATTGGTDFDFTKPVTGPTIVYAAWVRPSVTLGQYVRCNQDGTVNGGGQFYRLLNLSIRGYPVAGAPVNAAVVTLENVGSITTGTLPPGTTRVNALDTAGNGKVTFKFSPGLSVAQVETFLRGIVFQVKDRDQNHKIQVSVYGATN